MKASDDSENKFKLYGDRPVAPAGIVEFKLAT